MQRLSWIGVGCAALGVATLAGWTLVRPVPQPLQGEVEAVEVDVAAKIAGRVRTLNVREGQHVRAGELLALLDSPELDARLAQAEAARAASRAQSEKARRGTREEELRQAGSQWQRTRHAAELARTTFERLERLQRDGVVPRQRRDEAEAQWRIAEEGERAARAALDLAEHGARREDRDTAEALDERARAAVAEVEAFQRETRLVAPIAGEVARLNVEAGELVAPGFPLVTLVDLDDVWVSLHVREERLNGLDVGAPLTARLPALGGRSLALRVSSLAPLGDFATWRPSSAAGGFDLKTFEVRARPEGRGTGLRPGMSALVDWPGPR